MGISTRIKESSIIQVFRPIVYESGSIDPEIKLMIANYKKIDDKWYIIGVNKKYRVRKDKLRKRLVRLKKCGYSILSI